MTTIAAKLACLVALSIFSLLASAAPPTRTLSIDGSAQKGSNLCWAAVTEMAVNAVADPDPPMTQSRQAAFAAAGIADLPIPPEKAVDFAGQLTACADAANCNKRWHPVLESVTQDVPPSPQPLTEQQLMSEIGDFGRPVIFSWQYPDQNSVGRPVRGHYLIAIGYDSTTSSGFLKIWDPWPVGTGAARSIKYSTYAGSTLDMGLPAEHLLSYPGVRKPSPQVVTPNPPSSISIDGGAASSPPIQGVGADSAAARAARSARPRFREVSFTTAVRSSLPARQRGAILRQRGEGRADSAALTLGTPFPILALHVNDIVANQARPERLLRKRTISVLYPVMLRDQVVDSFLMANVRGKWVETGYANTEITRQLVRWRRQNIGTGGTKEQDFFVMSVPQYSAFFTSFGPGAKALAIAASTDPLIQTREGLSQRAVDVLTNIANAELQQRANQP